MHGSVPIDTLPQNRVKMKLLTFEQLTVGVCFVGFAAAISVSKQEVFQHSFLSQSMPDFDFGGKRNLQQNPDFICGEFEAASSVPLTCNCERYLEDEVQVNCQFDDEICGTGDNPVCITQSARILINAEGNAYEVESCSQLVSGDVPTKTCSTVVAAVPGDYPKGIESCSTTYNDNACNYCIPCTNEDGTLAITFDCCNIETDVKQTCGNVTSTGATSPQFDEIPEEEEGQCKGSYGPPGSASDLFGSIGKYIAGLAVLSSFILF